MQDAGLAAADLGLGALGTGLRSDDQAIGLGQGLLQIALLGAAFGEHLLELRHAQIGVALGDRHHLGGLEAFQLALVLDVLLGGGTQLLLEVAQALLVIGLAGQLDQRLLQH
ncbi:hypothetical protein D3C80_1338370 [compost metagenome]